MRAVARPMSFIGGQTRFRRMEVTPMYEVPFFRNIPLLS